MSESKHSPLPWYQRTLGGYIYDNEGRDIAMRNEAVMAADRDLKVRAVNGLAALLAACKKFRRDDLPEREQPLWDELQAAIAKAEGA